MKTSDEFDVVWLLLFPTERKIHMYFSRVAFKRKPVKPTRYKTWGAWVCGNNAKNLEEKGKRGRRACELVWQWSSKYSLNCFDCLSKHTHYNHYFQNIITLFIKVRPIFVIILKLILDQLEQKCCFWNEFSERWRKICRYQNIWVSIVKLKYLASQAAEWTPACEQWHAPACWTVAIDKV